MKIKKRIIIAFIAALAAAAAFLFFQKQVDSVSVRSGHKTLPEYSDASKPIETAVGKEFIISLDSNRTTGYGWQIARPLDAKMLKVMEIQHRSPVTKLVGAGGKDAWTLKALQPGNATVSFEYVRSWEKGVPPVKEEKFSVIIKK